MTAMQIAQILNDKGFNAEKSGKLVYVSLNRLISTIEVEAALGHPNNLIGKSGRKVVVIGQ